MNPQDPQAGTQPQRASSGDRRTEQANQGGTRTAGKNDPRSDASTRPAGKTQDRQDTTDPTRKKDSTGSDANGSDEPEAADNDDRLAKPNPRRIRKRRHPQRREINGPPVTRPTPRRATISRATRPIGRAAAPRIKIPPRKTGNKAGASRATRKAIPGRTSPGRPGLTNRPAVRRNPGRKRKARVLATTSRPARIPLSRVTPRKEMAVRRLRVSRTPRMRRTVRHRAATAPRPAGRPVKPTRPRATRMPRPASRGRIRLRNPMARPTARSPMARPTAPPRKATRNGTRTRLRNDRERS